MFDWLFGTRKAEPAGAHADDPADGLVAAFLLDGRGGAAEIGWDRIAQWSPQQGALWIHLNRKKAPAEAWLRTRAGLDPAAVEALLEEDVRPRSVALGQGVVVSLRGANATPGSEPEDMVAIRAYLEKDRIVTTRARRLLAMNEMRARFAALVGPADPTDALLHLAGQMMGRVSELVAELDDDADALEGAVLEGQAVAGRGGLAQVRRRAINLRRHLAPQREALLRLAEQPSPFIDDRDRAALRSIAERTTRIVEQIDVIRERAAVVQDEVMNHLAEAQNRNSYMLAVIAGLFLPLSFSVALVSTNVAGQPNHPDGFWWLLGGLGALAVLQLAAFRLMRWI